MLKLNIRWLLNDAVAAVSKKGCLNRLVTESAETTNHTSSEINTVQTNSVSVFGPF